MKAILLISVAIVVAVAVTSCRTVTTSPDGTVTETAPNQETVETVTAAVLEVLHERREARILADK